MQSELKPCPFCGGPAHSTPSVKSANFAAVIMCTENDCASVFGADLEIATQTWNRRAITAALSDKQAVEPTTDECEGADDPEERCPRHPKDCRCWQVDLNHPTVRSALVDVPAVEPVAKRWLVEETLPSGTIKWEVVEHEHHARKIAAMYRNAAVTPLYTHPPHREGEDSAEVVTLTRTEADHIAKRLEFDASWDKCGDGYYSIKRQLGALAATRSSSATGHSGGDHG